jgi:hypothetical protein
MTWPANDGPLGRGKPSALTASHPSFRLMNLVVSAGPRTYEAGRLINSCGIGFELG